MSDTILILHLRSYGPVLRPLHPAGVRNRHPARGRGIPNGQCILPAAFVPRGACEIRTAAHMIESGPLLVAIYGTLLGARHALEPDHLAAVSTMAAHGRSRADVLRVSGAWGAGHASLIVIAGTLITLLGWEIPRNLAGRADTLVGLALVVVGAWTLAGVRRDRIHVHPHVHGSQPPHAHFHLHPHSAEHSVHPQPPDWLRRPAAAYAVGTLHGMAGSGAAAALAGVVAPPRAPPPGYPPSLCPGGPLGTVAGGGPALLAVHPGLSF